MGLAEALTIVFVVLKLLGHLSWSWWWVFSPILVELVVVVVISVLFIAATRGREK